MIPILFSKEMVEAILDGKKTCTRRVIPDIDYTDLKELTYLRSEPNIFKMDLLYKEKHCKKTIKCRYIPGAGSCQDNFLYVKESYNYYLGKLSYQAGSNNSETKWDKWDNKLFMPKQLSRIILKTLFVYADLLYNITEDGAILEGFKSRDEFFDYFKKIKKIKKDTDIMNMPVWVIIFEVRKIFTPEQLEEILKKEEEKRTTYRKNISKVG